MLGGIGLLLGNRADTRVLYDPTIKCVIEGSYEVSGYGIETIFEGRRTRLCARSALVRREISASGKSRAFVNDTPVNLDTLRRVTSHLMDIHSQHDSVLLGSNEYQLQLVDTYAQDDDRLRNYRVDYQVYKERQATYDTAGRSGPCAGSSISTIFCTKNWSKPPPARRAGGS